MAKISSFLLTQNRIRHSYVNVSIFNKHILSRVMSATHFSCWTIKQKCP